MKLDELIENVRLVTADDAGANWQIRQDSMLGLSDGCIAWIGHTGDKRPQADRYLDARGRCLTPGLVDCHSHLVYAGHRSAEFAARMEGQSYEAIASSGGGILNTVNATRQASFEQLYAASASRLERLLAEGVTTVEIKSGYGLELETESRMLEVAREMARQYPVTLKTTFLGAHALPNEYQDRPDAYIDHVCNDMLPALHDRGLVDAVDVFLEHIAFNPDQCRRVFETAQSLGLPVKGHVGQLSGLGGAKLVARYAGLSADHLEYLDAEEVPAMAAAGTVAVLLPGAWYMLRETRKPDVKSLRAAAVRMAVATDLNPGSSPMASLLLAANQACVFFGLTVPESFAAITANAAVALGMGATHGRIEEGMSADLCLWNVDDPEQLIAEVALHKPDMIWKNGRHVG